MDQAVSPEDVAEKRRDLLQELTRTQTDLLARIESSLIERLHLKRGALFGTDGCAANAQLQQGVIVICRRHKKLRFPHDWLGSYLGVPEWQVADWEDWAVHTLRRDPTGEFSRIVLAVWDETDPGVDVTAA
jgi:hypothetical protein